MRLRRLAAAKSDGPGKRAASVISRQSLTTEENPCSSDTNRWSKFKIVFLGNSGVGKTWLVERVLARQRPLGPPLSNHHSNPNHAQHVLEELSTSGAGSGASAGGDSGGTIGVTVNLTKLRLPDSRTVLLQLWDTSGQEKYQNLVCSYLPGAQCIVLAYDPASGLQASRQALQRWHAFAKEAAAAAGATVGVTAAQPQDALVAVVAISRRRRNSGGGGGGDTKTEAAAAAATAAGVNFGRVFASSLCGCFFHQCGRRGGLLTPRWLADQLIRREQARSDAVARLFEVQQHGQQQRLVHSYSQQHHWQGVNVSGDGDGHSNTASSEEDDSVGCFWCHRLLCCRALRNGK